MQQVPHRPVLIVIAGPNGSGKTTITSKILRHEWLEDAVYVNPDQVAQDKYGDWNSIEAVGKRFWGPDIELYASTLSQPLRCPKCGSVRTRPSRLLSPFTSDTVYKKIWDQMETK